MLNLESKIKNAISEANNCLADKWAIMLCESGEIVCEWFLEEENILKIANMQNQTVLVWGYGLFSEKISLKVTEEKVQKRYDKIKMLEDDFVEFDKIILA